jgi:hypothetical protein
MFLYYYATSGVVTPPAMHILTVLLAGGQIGFPYLLSKLRLLMIVLWLVFIFGTTNSITHIWFLKGQGCRLEGGG